MMIINTSLAYIKMETPPKFCNPWGATSVCEQVYNRDKRICNMTCYIHTTSRRECDGQDLKVKKLEATHGHPK
jgi:hypothetical protein